MFLCCVHQQSGQVSPKEATFCCDRECGDGSVVGTPHVDEVAPRTTAEPLEETDGTSPETSVRTALQTQIDEVLAKGVAFEPHSDVLAEAGRKTAEAVAALLRANPEVALKIACSCGDVKGTSWAGPGQDVELSRRQAMSVQRVLSDSGCTNAVLAQGRGYIDGRSARCEVTLCSAAVFGTLREACAREAGDDVGREGKSQVLGVRLDVVFETQDGSSVTAAFTQRPLGMDLPHSMPLIVQDVRGQAIALGVRPGWQVASIGGYDVKAIALDDAYRIFQTAAAPLPEEGTATQAPAKKAEWS